MGILGNVGNLYMTMLIILLMLGFGFSGLWIIDYVMDSFAPNNKTNVKTKGSGTKVK